MLKTLIARLQQGHRTNSFPGGRSHHARPLPRPSVARRRQVPGRLPGLCRRVPDRRDRGRMAGVRLDLGRCLFCTDCMEACPEGAIAYTQDYRLATRTREDLVLFAERTSGAFKGKRWNSRRR